MTAPYSASGVHQGHEAGAYYGQTASADGAPASSEADWHNGMTDVAAEGQHYDGSEDHWQEEGFEQCGYSDDGAGPADYSATTPPDDASAQWQAQWEAEWRTKQPGLPPPPAPPPPPSDLAVPEHDYGSDEACGEYHADGPDYAAWESLNGDAIDESYDGWGEQPPQQAQQPPHQKQHQKPQQQHQQQRQQHLSDTQPQQSQEHTVGFLIPNDKVSKVIGKAGAGLKQMREACGVNVVAKPEDPHGTGADVCRLILSGQPEQMCIAFAVACGRAYAEEAETTAHVRIPKEWVGKAIGRGAENLKKAWNSYHVNVTVHREDLRSAQDGALERLVTLQGKPELLVQALQIVVGANGAGMSGSSPGAAQPPPSKQPVLQAPRQTQPVAMQRVAPVMPNAEEVHVNFICAHDLAGSVIGKQGVTIKEIVALTGCKFNFTKRDESGEEGRIGFMVGSIEEVCAAQDYVQNVLREARLQSGQPEPHSYTCNMLIRREVCGAVIGKGGQMIKSIRESCGCKVNMTEQEMSGQRICELDGPYPAVLEAQRRIHEAVTKFVRGLPSRGHSHAAVAFPMQDCAQVVKEVFAKYPASGGGWEAHGGAKRTQNLSSTEPAAKRPKLEESCTTDEPESRLLVPDQTAGTIIGKKGASLQNIRQMFSCSIELLKAEAAPHWAGERVVVIKAPTLQRAGAVEAVFKLVHQHPSQAGEMHSAKMLVPAAKVSSVAGDGGANMQRISDALGVQPVVGNEEVLGDHLFMVHGPSPAVLEAVKQACFLMDGEKLNLPQQAEQPPLPLPPPPQAPPPPQQQQPPVQGPCFAQQQDYTQQLGAPAQAVAHQQQVQYAQQIPPPPGPLVQVAPGQFVAPVAAGTYQYAPTG